MRRRLRVGRRAERQIREASDWWFENRRAAPELFKMELQRGFELIATQPHLGSPSLGKRTETLEWGILWDVMLSATKLGRTWLVKPKDEQEQEMTKVLTSMASWTDAP